MTYQELQNTLVPFCKGKKTLLDMIKDIWKGATPQPNLVNRQTVKMILPKQLRTFTALCLKENG
jgi:hypothetical protein